MRKNWRRTAVLTAVLMMMSLLLSGCVLLEEALYEEDSDYTEYYWSEESEEYEEYEADGETAEKAAAEEAAETETGEETAADAVSGEELTYETLTYADIPEYGGDYYCLINGNVPFFTEEEIAAAKADYYEYYSPLDDLGRCGYAMASVDTQLMPTEERGDIYWVHPSGWQKNSGYERTHLIAFQLAGENANEQNLITGTHYMNGEGMLPFEEMVGDYVRETDTRVLYRVTPIYQGDELVARGVLMEAMSLADDGEDILYCIFCYNVIDPEEGKVIDYATGVVSEGTLEINEENALEPTYIVNKNSGVFHETDCDSLENMNPGNRVLYFGTREEAIEDGYRPCPNCNP